MAEDFLDSGGIVVPESSLTVRRAKELVATLRGPGASFASLVDCRSSTESETVVFEVTVERPQIVANAIQRVERLSAVFRRDDSTYPEVLALRPDFAWTLHLNQREEEFPRSLCLYNRPWSEVRTTWTAPAFLARVRWWLGETARDSLHGDEQALESFILSWGHWLVLPEPSPDGKKSDTFAVTLPAGETGRVFVARSTEANTRRARGLECVVLRFEAPARRHGVLPRLPRSIADLGELLKSDDFDLVTLIRQRLRAWPHEHEATLDHQAIVLVDLPKSRTSGGPVETVEHAAFWTVRSVRELGSDLGVWAMNGKSRAMLLAVDESRRGTETKAIVLNVCRPFTRKVAAALNGMANAVDSKVVAVGAGALGSQVAMNLARAAWGSWTIIDHDPLLPHNLARHALDGIGVGHPKATAVTWSMNAVFLNEETAPAGVVADVLRPGDEAQMIAQAMSSADVILDFSASVAVARHLAGAESAARRLSLFLSPSGDDLVLLAEDKARAIPLTDLEMTYYAGLATEDSLRGHLEVGGAPIRYGLSCRDVSSRIPQDRVASLAGIGARAIRQATDSEGASLRIWRFDSASLGVQAIALKPEPFVATKIGDWEVRVAPSLLSRISDWREGRLPNETGGVLVGSVDHDLKVVHVALALPSPKDSDEWPTHYIRGCRELKERVDEIERQTAGNLSYVGEWHSHPKGAGTTPSTADLKVFAWIAVHTEAEGKPAVMLIAGEGGHTRCIVATVSTANPGIEVRP